MMLGEAKLLKYTLTTIQVLIENPGERGSKEIHHLVQQKWGYNASLSYIQKILPKMVKTGLLNSCPIGYCLQKPLNEITVKHLLGMCEMPNPDDPIYQLCATISQAMQDVPLSDIYQFIDTNN